MPKNYFFQQISWKKKYYLKTALKTNQCKHNLFLGLNRLLWLVKQLVLHLLNSQRSLTYQFSFFEISYKCREAISYFQKTPRLSDFRVAKNNKRLIDI